MRVKPALGLPRPGASLSALPEEQLAPDAAVCRAHSRHRSPWWFASEGEGRFDLPAPDGTLYVADDVETAVRERLRDRVLRSGQVMLEQAARFVVTTLKTKRLWRCAAVSSRKAVAAGITREISSCAPGFYPVSQAWARAIHDATFEGIRYGARFTPGPANAWALFGPAGDSAQPAPDIITQISGVEACRDSGIQVVRRPRYSALEVIE